MAKLRVQQEEQRCGTCIKARHETNGVLVCRAHPPTIIGEFVRVNGEIQRDQISGRPIVVGEPVMLAKHPADFGCFEYVRDSQPKAVPQSTTTQ